MDSRAAQVWAFGHSHHARIWQLTGTASQRVDSDRVVLEDNSKYVLNVGTTGLPFPGKGGPSVALVDFDTAEIRQIPLERV